MTLDKFQISLDVAEPIKPIALLSEHCKLSHQQLKNAMSKGAVWLTDGRSTRRLRRNSKTLKPGQKLHLYYDEKVLETEKPQAQLIADHQQYSIWYKPKGMLCQGSKWSDHCTITRFAEQHLTPERNAFLVHRLDRATSGLLILGHSKKITTKLCDLFQRREVDKRYLAIVEGRFEAQQTFDTPIEEKSARSHVTPIEYDEVANRTLVEVKIDTGRKHQIRRHLSQNGYPIVGDRLYGSKDISVDLQLTAWQLSFDCPISQQPRHYRLPTALIPNLVTIDHRAIKPVVIEP